MTARPGRPQSALTAGELSPALHERKDLKYYRAGARRMRNVEVLPQGGFRQAPGTRQVASLAVTSGNVRLFGFTSASGSVTTHVWTATASAVFDRDGPTGSYAIPHTDGQIAAVNVIQQLDTLIAFHPDVAPRRVLRQGSDASWGSAAAPLTGIPNWDYGGVYVNGQSAIWEINVIGLPNTSAAADFFYVITVSGEDTAAIQMPLDGGSNPDWSAFATVIRDAILDLPTVEPGVTVAYTNPGSRRLYAITFAGTGNEGDDWVVSMRCVNADDKPAPAYRKQRGIAPGEPVISASKGWPRCGMFYQQRMLMGGPKSLPNAWMASWTGGFFDFNTDTSNPAGAMLVPMAETDGGEAIERLAAVRSPFILTTAGEYWLAERTISKANAPNHVRASGHGIAAGVPMLENEGAAIFVSSSRGVVFEFRYNEVDQNFVTTNLSLLASHLVEDIRDLAISRASDVNDANILHAVRGDGALATFTLLREQEVTAASLRQSDGKFLAAMVNSANELMLVAEREVDGADARFLERAEPGLLLDQAIDLVLDPASATVDGLDDHEGAEVWAIADGDVLGPFTVAEGEIELPQEAENVTVGRWTPPLMETLPPPRFIGPDVVLERRGRIHTVRLNLIDTTSVAVGANGGRVYDVPLFRFGDEMDRPGLENGFTGTVVVRGLTGYSDKPTVVITQKRPGRLHVSGITVEAAL